MGRCGFEFFNVLTPEASVWLGAKRYHVHRLLLEMNRALSCRQWMAAALFCAGFFLATKVHTHLRVTAMRGTLSARLWPEGSNRAASPVASGNGDPTTVKAHDNLRLA